MLAFKKVVFSYCAVLNLFLTETENNNNIPATSRLPVCYIIRRIGRLKSVYSKFNDTFKNCDIIIY